MITIRDFLCAFTHYYYLITIYEFYKVFELLGGNDGTIFVSFFDVMLFNSAATGSALCAMRKDKPAPGSNSSILSVSSNFASSVRDELPPERSFTASM
jgi:hypothetical protein